MKSNKPIFKNRKAETSEKDVWERFKILLEMEREAIIKFDSSLLEKLTEEKKSLTEELLGRTTNPSSSSIDKKSGLKTRIRELTTLNDINRRLLYSSLNLFSALLSTFSGGKPDNSLYQENGMMKKTTIPICINRRT